MGKIWDFNRPGDPDVLFDRKGNSVKSSEIEAGAKLMGELNKDHSLIMIICRNMIGAIYGYASSINSGSPVMLLSSEIPVEMRNNIMDTYLPSYILLPEEIRTDYPFMEEAHKFLDYSVLKTNYDSHYPVHPDLGLMITTSGSTGSVKFVRQSFDNVRFNANANAEFMKLTTSERTITALPMQYSFGITIINATLSAGGQIYVTDKSLMEEEFWDFFEDQHITSFHGVPNAYDTLKHFGIFEEDFPDLKLMSEAGGRLSNELHEYYAGYAKKYNKQFYLVYGQSEASGVVAYLPAEDAAIKTGSVGKPVSGGRITLLDEKDEPITEVKKSGEIIYEGPNVAMGYALNGEDLSRGNEWEGRLRTGDVGYLDEDGYLFITGRIKRIIKMYGHRISLDEVDSMIMEKLHILSASTGSDNNLVIYVTNEGEKQAVFDLVRKNIQTAATHTRVEVIEAFPRTETGKIKFSELPI
ncbi:MAG: AMP-binding protein [Lachnospiraceae bacterium]|nr:AMP-binding protein [Lachnospiraceae bacterium]